MIISNTNQVVQETVTKLASSYMEQGYMFRLNDSSQGNMIRVELQLPNDEEYICIRADKEFIFSTKAMKLGILSGVETIEIIVERRRNTFDIIEEISKQVLYIIRRSQSINYISTTDVQELIDIQAVQLERSKQRQSTPKIIEQVSQKVLKGYVKGKDGFGKKVLGKLELTRVLNDRQNGYKITNTKNSEYLYLPINN